MIARGAEGAVSGPETRGTEPFRESGALMGGYVVPCPGDECKDSGPHFLARRTGRRGRRRALRLRLRQRG
ncbi:hypothetical protein NOCARDAX2BIS_40118 [Nocardioides sp. AX2bis]|nr:hypothetical protein NOCARDAX2BIS_40118 [Nocardioides sp. AX2bis]